MVVENCGIPFPTEGAFIVSQHLINTHVYGFWTLYWWMVFTQVLGAIIAYGLGRGFSEWILSHKNAKLLETQKRIDAWYQKYGTATIFATRLIGYVRPWSSLVAGIACFPFVPFVLWTTLGTMLFVYPTMQATGLLVRLWANFPGLHILISLVMLALFLGLVIYGLGKKYWKKTDPAK